MGKLREELAQELKLYVRQLAWLNTAPKPDVKPEANQRLAEFERELDKDRPTRLRELEEAGKPVPLPPCRAPHLVNWLMQIGPVLGTGMGAVAITHQDIRSWRENVGVPLAPWQALLLRELSQAWLSMAAEAAKPECPSPYETEEVVADRRPTVRQGLRDLFGSLIAQRGERDSANRKRKHKLPSRE